MRAQVDELNGGEAGRGWGKGRGLQTRHEPRGGAYKLDTSLVSSLAYCLVLILTLSVLWFSVVHWETFISWRE